MLLKLYVWALNHDPGTTLSTYKDGRKYHVHGNLLYLVTVISMSGKQWHVLRALVTLNRKALARLAEMEPAMRSIASLMERGVPLEMMLDALDEAGVQHLESRA